MGALFVMSSLRLKTREREQDTTRGVGSTKKVSRSSFYAYLKRCPFSRQMRMRRYRYSLFISIIDIHIRKTIGWAMGRRKQDRLVIDAFKQAYHRKGSKEGLIVHTDQGS